MVLETGAKEVNIESLDSMLVTILKVIRGDIYQCSPLEAMEPSGKLTKGLDSKC